MKYQQFKKVNQISFFKEIPTIKFVNEYLSIFGLTNITDCRPFCRNFLKKNDLHIKGEKLINELVDVYLVPYKTNVFNINNKMCVSRYLTILRYLITFYSYNLFRYERTIEGKKDIYYRILKIENGYNQVLELNTVKKIVNYEAIESVTTDPPKEKMSGIKIERNVKTIFPN